MLFAGTPSSLTVASSSVRSPSVLAARRRALGAADELRSAADLYVVPELGRSRERVEHGLRERPVAGRDVRRLGRGERRRLDPALRERLGDFSGSSTGRPMRQPSCSRVRGAEGMMFAFMGVPPSGRVRAAT